MAELPRPHLHFDRSCRTCAVREVQLPPPLPHIGDDFDWLVRDYDGFRRFMMEDLAARFPERTRWTSADLEVVLVEAFATVLDQLSDMLDRVAAEATLETARRPQSVRQLLRLIGYDAVHSEGAESEQALDELWQREPQRMDAVRREGPRTVHAQRRMVSLQDYAVRLEEHPLVERAHAAIGWGGAWPVVHVALMLSHNARLSDNPFAPPLTPEAIEELKASFNRFHREHGLPTLDAFAGTPSTCVLLQPYVEALRMLGQEVRLQDAEPIGIELALSIRVRPNYFQSEVRRDAERVLGRGSGGFFLPGRLRFGEDLHVADIVQALMALDGVENVCVNRFKRLGLQFPDESARGVIVLSGLEIAVCDNDPDNPERGYMRFTLHGGRAG